MALAEELVSFQANSFAMYSQAHGYHWNVEGVMFKQFHAFFLEIYEDVYDAIDPISENIRKLGQHAPFGPLSWLNNASIKVNDDASLSAIEMIRELTVTNAALVQQCKHVIDIAQQEDEEAIANFVADRLNQHQFWNWQLTSTLKTMTI